MSGGVVGFEFVTPKDGPAATVTLHDAQHEYVFKADGATASW